METIAIHATHTANEITLGGVSIPAGGEHDYVQVIQHIDTLARQGREVVISGLNNQMIDALLEWVYEMGGRTYIAEAADGGMALTCIECSWFSYYPMGGMVAIAYAPRAAE